MEISAFISILSSLLQLNKHGIFYYPHCVFEKSEAQRGKVTDFGSRSQGKGEPGFKPPVKGADFTHLSAAKDEAETFRITQLDLSALYSQLLITWPVLGCGPHLPTLPPAPGPTQESLMPFSLEKTSPKPLV
jgi:hypothetical protein